VVKVSREFVVFASLQFGEQQLDGLLHFGQSREERVAVHQCHDMLKL
jgi:hypothetical protein